MEVFFHADDAGAGRQATRKIIECWEEGYIDGFSIIANEECYDIITHGLNKHPKKKAILSAHLNLTDGVCLSASSINSSIASKNGRFKLTFFNALLFFLRSREGKKRLRQLVLLEWDKQIVSLKNMLGERKISVLDSHNHLHLLPPFFEIILELAAKHNIDKIRMGRELFITNRYWDFFKLFFWINSAKWLVINYLCKRIKNEYYSFESKSEFIIGVLYSGVMSPDYIKKAIERANIHGVNSLEIIYHPGRASVDEMNKWALSRQSRKFFVSKRRDIEYDTAKIIRNTYGTCFENN